MTGGPAIRQKTRVGLICYSTTFPACEAKIVRQILADSNFEICCVVQVEYPKEFQQKQSIPFRNRLWHWYSHQKLFPQMEAIRPVMLAQDLINVPLIRCVLDRKGKFACTFKDEDVQKLRDLQPDVLMNFQYRIIRGDILTIPQHGVWSFHHDDEQKYRGGPAGFWEIYFGEPFAGAILQILTDKLDAGIILRKGYFRTRFRSLALHRDQVFFESANWVLSALRELRQNPSKFAQLQVSKTTAPIYKDPSNLQMIRFLATTVWIRIQEKLKELFFYEVWNVGVIEQPIQTVAFSKQLPKIQWLPEYRWPFFSADPFGYVENGVPKIYFEFYDYRKSKGTISSVSRETNPTDFVPTEALSLPIHLSYPFIVEHEGKRYCMPESLMGKAVRLYPISLEGTIEGAPITLLEGDAYVDPTLFQWGGYYWLFCTISDPHADACSLLYAYYSRDIFGPYQPHLMNPILSDVRSSRPAGTPFLFKGELFRPTQDCSRTYGGAIVVNRILELSPEAFQEMSVSRLEPNSPYNLGTHHLAALGEQRTLIDGKRLQFSFHPFLMHLSSMFRRDRFDKKHSLLDLYKGELIRWSDGQIERFLVVQGVYPDGWTEKKISLKFKSEELEYVRILTEFPSWSGKVKTRIRGKVNGVDFIQETIQPKQFELKVGPLRKGQVNEITFAFKEHFRMPPPDKRSCYFRIVEMSGYTPSSSL